MPIKIRKLKGGGYRVTDKGRVTARRTTLAKAKAQARAIRASDHGWKGRRK